MIGKRKSTTMGALLLRILVPDKAKVDVDYVRMKIEHQQSYDGWCFFFSK
ncbi:hypothetical protein [Paenibacillus amylolyticus]|nr:hypothetical protein [Paenibacillus amylolyticus]